MFTVIAIQRLNAAGYKVSPAGNVPGLWNVEGLAQDVTTNQLSDIAEQYGAMLLFGMPQVIDWSVSIS